MSEPDRLLVAMRLPQVGHIFLRVSPASLSCTERLLQSLTVARESFHISILLIIRLQTISPNGDTNIESIKIAKNYVREASVQAMAGDNSC